MDTYLAAVAADPGLVHALPLPSQLEQIVQLKKALQKGGKKRQRRSSPSSSDFSSDSDDSSDKDKDKGKKGVPRDSPPDSSSSDTDASSDTCTQKAHKGRLKKKRDMGKLLKGSIKQLPSEQVSEYVLRFRTQLGEADCGNYAEDSR
jgi:hypothetical protein